MLRIKSLLMLVPILTLAGCAGMSAQECLVSDWRSVGFEDGAAGRAEGRIANYRQACTEHGVSPDLDQYRQGHSEGVEVYCRPGTGFEVGSRGGRYQGVCPADMEPEFLAAYSEGRHLYELQTAVRGVNNQIAARQRRLDQLKKDMAQASAEIISDETPSAVRAELLVETATMAEEYGKIEAELQDLEVERVLRQDELLAYQETLAFGF